MKKYLKHASIGFLACGIIFSSSYNCLAKSPDNYLDKDSVVGVNYIESLVPQTLGIIYPKTVATTTSDTFYIFGTSDPNKPLYMNDNEITDRASNGLFEVVVSVPQNGVFSCVFKQDGIMKVVPIFKNVDANTQYNGFAWAPNIIKSQPIVDNSIYPVNNVIIKDKKIKLQCSAPAGAKVTATFCNATFSLAQEKSSTIGVTVKYSNTIDLSNSLENDKSYDLGNVIYNVDYQGEVSQYESKGQVYYSRELPPFIKISWAYGLLRDNSKNDSKLISVLKSGTVDRVVKEENDFYQLGCGGWINKRFVEPIFNSVNLINNITGVNFENDEKCEKIILNGSVNPVFTSGMTKDQLIVRLYNTIGNLDMSSLTQYSSLFDDIKTKNENNCLEITIRFKSDNIWGYNVEYDGDNKTIIYLKKRPQLSSDSLKPLQNITVLLDPGHGGSDTGALGLLGEIGGAAEKDINLQNALAVGRRLEILGAHVIMTRDDDKYVSLNDRATMIEVTKPDFVLVLHADASANSMSANGLTLHCTRDNIMSYPFSSMLSNMACNYIERYNRGVKFTDFYVAKNTFCPTAFGEIGFLTNPTDVSNLFSSQKVFDLANAIGDTIIKYLSVKQ